MIKKEAIDKAESKFWEGMNAREIAGFQLFETRLCIPWEVFHEAVENTLGRPVFTHEFAYPESLQREFNKECKAPDIKDRSLIVVAVGDGTT